MQDDRSYICRLIDIYGEALSPRQRDVVDLYYNEDLSLAEISENCGITRQGVRDAIVHGVASLREMESKLRFAEKSAKISALSRELLSVTEQPEVKRIADAIIGEL